MQNTPVQAIYSTTTTILCSLVELQRTVVWKNRVGKRFKERGQGLRRGMQCGGTRVRTDLAGGLSTAEQSRHHHAKSSFILMSYYSIGKPFAFDKYVFIQHSLHS
jgi:hypothetical protein